MPDDIGDCSKHIQSRFLILCITVSILVMCSAASAVKIAAKPRPHLRGKNDKVKMLWIDAEQDVFQMSDRLKVQTLLDKCVQSGINTIAVDVKPFSGYVLYTSKIAPRMPSFKGKPYPENFDLLKVIIREGHKRGLDIHAALNIFSEGLKAEKEGPVFANPSWECVVYKVSDFILAPSGQEQILEEVNQSTLDNVVSIYNPDYGKKLFPLNHPGNLVDGNTNSVSSKWVSGNTHTLHWVTLEWSTPIKIDTLKLHMVKNYIIPGYSIQYFQSGQWIDLVQIKDNHDLAPVHSFGPVNTRKIRVLFDDCGNDAIARLREIEVLSIQGNTGRSNMALDSRVKTDSVISRNTSSVYYVVESNTLEEIIRDDNVPNDGLEIPENGYVMVANGKTQAWMDKYLSEGNLITRGLKSRLLRESEIPEGMLVYVNPGNPEVRERAMMLIEEVTRNYDIDGIILDRARYDNIKVDFSDLSRRHFEQFIGETIQRWPEDIYEIVPGPKGPENIPGKYYQEWIYWRAANIHDFIVEARTRVKDIKPNIPFGDYVGGWYPEYYEVGVNWASSKYDPSKYYDWATPGYRSTGYAEYLDYLSPGLYYPDLTVSEALAAGKKDYASLEGGIRLVNQVVGSSTKVYTGLYYPNIASPERFKKAVSMSLNQTDGIMLFSLYYFESQNKWNLLKEALINSPPIVTEEKTTKTMTNPSIPNPPETFSLRSIWRMGSSWFGSTQ